MKSKSERRQGRWRSHGATGFIVVGIPSVLAYLGPLHWTFDLLPPFRYQYAVIGLFYLLVTLVTRNYLAVACYGILCGMNFHFVAPSLFPAAAQGGESDLSLTVHNVHFENDRVEDLIAYYDTLSPDVLVLIEPSAELVASIRQDREWSVYSHTHMRDDPYSLAVYSKFPFDGETVMSQGLPYIIAQIDHPKGPMTIVGMHAPLPWYQERRYDYLRDTTRAALADSGPGIVAGDFNMTPYNPSFQDFLYAGKLRPSRNGFGVLPTWPDSPLDFLKIPIDHVLVTPHFRPVTYALGPFLGADHAPIHVQLQLVSPN